MTKADAGVSLSEALSLIGNRWKHVLAAIVLGVLAAQAAVSMTDRTYEAVIVLIPSAEENVGGLGSLAGQFGGLASLAGISLGGGNKGAEIMATLRSQEFARDFITRKGLLQKFYSKKWNASTSSWEGPEEKWPTISKAWVHFDKNIRFVTEDRRTGLIKLQVRWKDRAEAAEWANDLAASLNETIRNNELAEAQKMIGLLKSELDEVQVVELRSAISRLMEIYEKKLMYARSKADIGVKVIDRAQVPDVDQYIWPKRILMLALGAMLGFIVGAAAVLISGLAANSAQEKR